MNTDVEYWRLRHRPSPLQHVTQLLHQEAKASMDPPHADPASAQYRLVDQSELELSITEKASHVLLAKEVEAEQKRLDKAQDAVARVRKKVALLEKRLQDPRAKISQKREWKDEIEWIQKEELPPLLSDVKDIEARLADAQAGPGPTAEGAGRQEGESEKEYLIRTGKITAFGSKTGFAAGTGQSSMHLRRPGFKPEVLPKVSSPEPQEVIEIDSGSDGDAYHESDPDSDLAESPDIEGTPETETARNIDDGDEYSYQQRVKKWALERRAARAAAQGSRDEQSTEDGVSTASFDWPNEWQNPHPTTPDAVLNEQFRLPGDIFSALFDYQKTCVQWLWELYTQKTGGIIGDEMGLGKTVQVIAFLAGLHYLGHLTKPVLLVVPATVMNQWVNEFHRWWPPLRCVILHNIGSGMGKRPNRAGDSDDELSEWDGPSSPRPRSGSNSNARDLVQRVVDNGHVIVTTYAGLRIHSRHLLPVDWGYAVLDEGHKIRNPNSEVTLACKRIKTVHRVILSGTPIQNNLVELWLLFDFVFPGRLGTLPVFELQFALPIRLGGYANAQNVQVQTAYQCAVMLRDMIAPYLLRRLKVDVAQDLPKKQEMVLFVKLTQVQQDLYEQFLGSGDVGAILSGRRNVLMGVDMLRKICNHPDLADRDRLLRRPNYPFGSALKLGKMQVLRDLLVLWRLQGHRTLLFCQTRQMLDILEGFVNNLDEANPFHYLRMDGTTPVVRRQQMVDTFNNDESLHVFLLTTKVGGLGINLTGADRVIIYDPDWNPLTDIQARERAWRLGQKKDITIYRLMTVGTIEEKIYHRQIFKTFLTNKILKDPKQRRFFKLNDLHDLFTLGDPDESGTEPGGLFQDYKHQPNGQNTLGPTLLASDDFYQVASLAGVLKLDKFAGDDDAEDTKQDPKATEDSRIMDGLFSKSGVVHSTLQHDDVMEQSHEATLVEREASKVARRAAEALRQSRLQARKTAVGTPTWTGKFGRAGKFGPAKVRKVALPAAPGKLSALSSSSILSGLRRNHAEPAPLQKPAKPTKALVSPAATHLRQELLEHLVEFLEKQPGRFSRLDAILKSLPESVQQAGTDEMVVVRSLLREAAEWDKTAKGWRLRSDFALGS